MFTRRAVILVPTPTVCETCFLLPAMATRAPLIDRQPRPMSQTTSQLSRSSTKRPLSPDSHIFDAGSTSAAKRARSGPTTSVTAANSVTVNIKEDKTERKRQERLARDAEFRAKYTKAFPGFRFFLDRESVEGAGASRKMLEKQIHTLGAVSPQCYAYILDLCSLVVA